MCICVLVCSWHTRKWCDFAVMDLLSALIEAGSLPSELLQQMVTTDAVTSVKEQQVRYFIS